MRASDKGAVSIEVKCSLSHRSHAFDEERRIARKIATLEEQVAACGAKLTACDDQLAAGESERAQLRSLLEMTTAAQEHSLAEAARQLEPVQRRLAETIALKVAQEAECARLR